MRGLVHYGLFGLVRNGEVNMKCKDCIFSKHKDLESCECFNPHSDEFGQILFEKYDGCIDGKKSTFGIDAIQRVMLMSMNNC